MKRNLVVVALVVIVAVVAFYIGQYNQLAKIQEEKKQAEQAQPATFAGAEKHEVTLEEAKKYIQRYQKSFQLQKTRTPQIHGGLFERGAIDKILAQPGCNGLRIYYGSDEKGMPNLVLVGVDTAGKDMVQGSVVERQFPCPPYCDETSSLIQ